jgi:hypothetical protein
MRELLMSSTGGFQMAGRRLVLKEKLDLLARFRENNLTAARFCRENGIVLATFNLWKSKHSKPEPKSSLFVPVKITSIAHDEARAHRSVAKLMISPGLCLEFSEQCDPIWLGRVIGVLR